MDHRIELNPNEVVSFLGKLPQEFTRADMIEFIREKGIRMVDFMYPAEDGRVKTLNFTVNNLAYVETILTEGERVDGSSLFPSFIEAGNSDLYVIPRYRTAFVDPFNEIPTLCFLCSFFTKDGEPFDCAPYMTLMRAEDAFYQSTGLTFEAMGELEYYVITDADPLFPATDQKGYHESEPFAKLNDFRRACMVHVAKTGGQIKYGHSEVGNFTLDGKIYEQNEIEFLPNPVETAADQLLLAKWVIRNLAYQWGLDVSFRQERHSGTGRQAVRGRPPRHRRPDADGSVHHRLRQQEPHFLLPPGSAPGGADQRMLGRLQPLRPRPRAAGLVLRGGHVHPGQSARASGSGRHHRQADLRNAQPRLFRRHLPADGRPVRRRPKGPGDAGRRGPEDRGREICRHGHPQERERRPARDTRLPPDLLRRICRLPGENARRL